MKVKDVEGILKVSNAMIKKKFDEVDKRVDKAEFMVKNSLTVYEDKANKAIVRAESVKNGKDGVSIKGDTGKDGKDGIDGIDGKNGLDGRNGRDGRDGKDGKDGRNGLDGKSIKGDKGDDGDSAYIVAKKNGFKGTEKEWLESLKAELNMIPNQAVAGYTNPLPPRGNAGQVLAKKSNQDRDYEWVDQSGGGGGEPKLDNDRLITKDPTGFTNADTINVSFDPTTKKITLTGDFQAYCRGVLIPELVSGWQSPAIADASPSGTYFLKYTPSGFVFDVSPFDLSCIQIAYVYYRANGTYLFCLRETHSFMDWRAHKEFHETIGTYRTSGGTLSDYTLQSTTSTLRRPNTDGTTLNDEDLQTINPSHTSKLYTIAYLQADGSITSDFDNTEIVKPSTGIPNANLFNGSVWTQTPINDGQNTRYMSMWQYAKPVGTDVGSQRYQYVWLQGQSVGDLASQEALTPNGLNLGQLATIVPELVFINQVIIRYRANPTNDWDIYSVKSLAGNKIVQTSAPSGAFLTSVAHDATLTGDGTIASPLSVAVVGGVTSVFTRTGDVVATSGDYSLDQITQSASYRTVTDTEKSTWNGKQDALVSGTNIKTINAIDLLGSGNITIAGAVGGSTAYFLTSPVSNSTTTLADVTEWTVPVVSGKKYKFEVIGTYQTNTTTTGGKLAVYARDSAVTTVNGWLQGSISDVQVATEIKATIYACAASNATGSFLLTTGVATINRPHAIGGQMVISCTTSGNVRFQWAGEAATAAQLNAGSVLIVTPLN